MNFTEFISILFYKKNIATYLIYILYNFFLYILLFKRIPFKLNKLQKHMSRKIN